MKRNENTNPRQPPLFSSSAKANPGLNEPSCSCTTIYAGIADTFLYVYCLSRGIKIDQTIQLSNQDNNTSEKIKGVRKIETVAGYLCRKNEPESCGRRDCEPISPAMPETDI